MACLTCLLLFVAGADPGQARAQSWSKPGVSFAAYRADSVECAKIGYFRDVSGDEPAKRFVTGFTRADNDLNSGLNVDAWLDAIKRTQPDRRLREVQAIQVNDVEQCLVGKGYSRFQLSKAEDKALRRLKVGSPERHRFLYDLASQPRGD